MNKVVINEVAYIENGDKKSLVNLKTRCTLLPPSTSYHIEYNEILSYFYIERSNFVSIYDAKKHFFLAYNYKGVKSYNHNLLFTSILKDNVSKYHIFDEKLFRESDVFYDKYDDIKHFRVKSRNLFIVTLNGLKGVYESGVGFIDELEYKDIENKGLFTIYTTNEGKFFKNHEFEDSKSKTYENIIPDKFDETIIYLKNKRLITVFNLLTNEELFTINCEEVSFQNNLFIVKRRQEYGIVKYYNKGYKIVLDIKYKKIIYDKKYFLYKNNLIGLYDKENGIFIEAKHKDIYSLNSEYKSKLEMLNGKEKEENKTKIRVNSPFIYDIIMHSELINNKFVSEMCDHCEIIYKFKDFKVIVDEEFMYFIDYNNNLLLTAPLDTKVEQIRLSNINITCYKINEYFYIYYKNMLVIVDDNIKKEVKDELDLVLKKGE